MGVVLLIFRFIALVLVTIGCTLTVVIGSLVGGGHRFALKTQQVWSRVMLPVFGVKTILHGNPAEVGLLMSNHQSYIDIWIIPKYAISVFVAKAEVKNLPLVGWGASSVDTLYVDRKSKDSGRETRQEISKRIKKGRSVIVFPEGTTGEAGGLLPLKPGMFYAAANEGFPIVPMVIFYEDPGLAWVGDDNMAGHFFRNFSKLSTTAHVVFGEPITGNDGEELMVRVRDWKLEQLEKFRNTFSEQYAQL